ncbi:MAG: hypothetical protein SPI14_02315 [Arcanobacterium sp.]|nr:hypothetical protein [Arcanobacterium sp.]
MAEGFGLKIALEGEREFKAALRDINASFKVLGSEMKLVDSQFAKNDNSTEKLTARNQVLGREVQLEDTQQNAQKPRLPGRVRLWRVRSRGRDASTRGR